MTPTLLPFARKPPTPRPRFRVTAEYDKSAGVVRFGVLDTLHGEILPADGLTDAEDKCSLQNRLCDIGSATKFARGGA